MRYAARPMNRSALLLLSSLALSACAPTPPAHWAQGGALVELPRARWVQGDTTIDIMPDGKVLFDGEHELSVDRGGRVFDPDGEPIALLEPDGRLLGPNDTALGVVGALNASLPGEDQAWITVAEAGEVIAYGDDGERLPLGQWVGCAKSLRAHQVCTLVTHLVGLRLRAMAARAGDPVGVSVGVGVGVSVPVR
jgi:hypothetical protein